MLLKKIGYAGDIPVNLDDKTLFKIALDTKNKLPSDIRLKVDTNTNLVGDKELENAKLTVYLQHTQFFQQQVLMLLFLTKLSLSLSTFNP